MPWVFEYVFVVDALDRFFATLQNLKEKPIMVHEDACNSPAPVIAS